MNVFDGGFVVGGGAPEGGEFAVRECAVGVVSSVPFCELGDGRWEITYSTEVKLPSGGRVTSTPMKGPIEAEAKRLCPNGYVPFEIAPVSLGAGPNGQGLFTRTSAIVECNPSDPAS